MFATDSNCIVEEKGKNKGDRGYSGWWTLAVTKGLGRAEEGAEKELGRR